MRRLKHVGIAAVSAEGAALCYRTICSEGAAIFGRHAHPEVTMHTIPLSEYMKRIEADRWDEVGELLLESAAVLERSGSEFLICPDNTVHQALDAIRDRSPLPWLHIAEEVAVVAKTRRFRRLGILGTRYLMEGPVYTAKLEAAGIDREVPTRDERGRLNEIIFEELVNGRFEEPSREFFRQTIRGLGRRGCDAVVLGCTEIPMLISDSDSALPALDSTRILARAALREAANV